jgi:hypothetical protein
MKTPRYIDNRYLHGYIPADRTDIRVTFRRIRREMGEASAREEAMYRNYLAELERKATVKK